MLCHRQAVRNFEFPNVENPGVSKTETYFCGTAALCAAYFVALRLHLFLSTNERSLDLPIDSFDPCFITILLLRTLETDP